MRNNCLLQKKTLNLLLQPSGPSHTGLKSVPPAAHIHVLPPTVGCLSRNCQETHRTSPAYFPQIPQQNLISDPCFLVRDKCPTANRAPLPPPTHTPELPAFHAEDLTQIMSRSSLYPLGLSKFSTCQYWISQNKVTILRLTTWTHLEKDSAVSRHSVATSNIHCIVVYILWRTWQRTKQYLIQAHNRHSI